jgi:hypothetical protein
MLALWSARDFRADARQAWLSHNASIYKSHMHTLSSAKLLHVSNQMAAKLSNVLACGALYSLHRCQCVAHWRMALSGEARDSQERRMVFDR